MTELAKLTSPEAQAYFCAGTVALLPCGATEPHGPHLPLDTDVTIAQHQARVASSRLESLGVRTLVLPALSYGITNYTHGFKGRISLRAGSLFALLEDILSALDYEGIRHLVLLNAHLEPDNVRVLRNALLDWSEPGKDRLHAIFADVTRRKLAAELGSEFQSGDCHAGSYETSLVLAADPAAVRPHAGLPAVRIDLMQKMQQGVKTFQEAGADQAYCGEPARSSREEGERLYEILGSQVVRLARENWPQLFQPVS